MSTEYTHLSQIAFDKLFGRNIAGQEVQVMDANGNLTISGLTASGNIFTTGTITASNFSGSNTGDVTLGTANGLSLSGQQLSLAAASSSAIGVVSTGTQSFAGSKTFKSALNGLSLTLTGKITSQNTQPNLFNVIAYGAKGDGTTDDSPAIQTAADALVAAGGGVLWFPYATYKLGSRISINCSNVRISGDRPTINFNNDDICFFLGNTSASFVKGIIVENLQGYAITSGGGGQQFVQFNSCQDILVRDCYMQDFAGAGTKFAYKCSYGMVYNCHADNIGVTAFQCTGQGSSGGTQYNQFIYYIGNRATNFNYGLECKQTKDVFIIGNNCNTSKVSSVKYAIVVARDYTDGTQATPERILIDGNIVTDAADWGINVTDAVDVTITNNIVRNTGGNAITASISHGVISNNVVTNCNTGISVGLASHITDGTGAVSPSTNYDACYASIIGNNVLGTTTGPSFSLNKTGESLISNNIARKQSYAGYAYQLTTCTNTVFESNQAIGGSLTYGFRYETDSTGMTVRNNHATGYSVAETSIPSAHLGWAIEQGNLQGRFLPMVQTTNATGTTLFTLTVDQNDSNVFISANVMAKSSSGSAKAGVWELRAHALRGGSGVALQSGVVVLFQSTTDSNLSATMTTSGNNVLIQVTGIAATNINWQADITTIRREV